MAKLFEKINRSDPRNWIALLRIVVGLMFLTTWLSNALEGYYTSDGLLKFFTQVYPTSANSLAWYGTFIENVILPIRGIFAPFQLIAECVLGLALCFGIFTHLFSLAGIFFLINTLLATMGHDWLWSYILPISILVVAFLAQAGRKWGVDIYFLKKYGERGILF